MENRVRYHIATLVILALLLLLVAILLPPLPIQTDLDLGPRMTCGTNLSRLGKAMLLYANDYDDTFPTGSSWCDLLLERSGVSREMLQCEGAGEGQCHYAMNKHAIGTGNNASRDMVVLFESTSGWNQVGGPENLTTDHHQGIGCNVLFMDSHVEFVEASKIPKLRWKEDQLE